MDNFQRPFPTPLEPAEPGSPDNSSSDGLPHKDLHHNPLLSFFGFLLEILQIMVIVGVLSFLIRMFIVQPFYILGASMEPKLQEGQILLIDELSYRLMTPKRGDIIILHPPRDTRDYIKRIIGLPGEKITINSSGEVLINDHVIYEPYLAGNNKVTKGTLEVTLGSDDYFVMGDNRQVSNDSRGGVDARTNEAQDPWTIHKGDIVGKAFLRWWPFSSFQYFSAQTYTF